MFAGNRGISPAGLGWRWAAPLSTPDLWAVLRSQLGIVAVAAVAVYWGSNAAAVWATGAGAIAGAVALQGSPVGRARLVVAVSLLLGVAVLVAALTAPYGVVFVAAVAAWSFAAGMQWALGGHPGLVAAAATGLLVVAAPAGWSLASAAAASALAVCAGLVQAALVAVWPPRRWRAQRDALSRAYQSLGATARRLAGDFNAPVDVAPLTWLREVFTDSQASRRPGAYHGGYRLPERITASLAALRGSRGDGDGPADAEVSTVLTAAATLLDAIADHSRSARRDAEHALAGLDAAVQAMTGSESSAAERFSRQLQEAATLRFGPLSHPELLSHPATGLRAIRTHLGWMSPILRHAIRLAVALTLAAAAARFSGVEHGQWMALTVLWVLRPETAHTYTRCAGRIAGIAAGLAVVGALTIMWQPSGPVAVVCAAVFVGLTYAVARFGYLVISATLAAAVEFIVGIDGGAGGAGLADQLFAVVLGGALAVLAHVILPDPALVRLRHRAGELLKTEIDYAAMVIRAHVHALDHATEALSAAWQRAFRARAAFEAASGATRAESRELRRWLRSYRAALNAVTAACTSLERHLPASPPVGLGDEFVAAVDDYVDALRGSPPTPATPWSVDTDQLTAANQQLREVASSLDVKATSRVLVAEVGTITRQLLSIADAARTAD